MYYQHSGMLDIRRTTLAILASLTIGILLGACYGWLILYTPYAGHITIFFTLGFGGLLGFVTGRWLRWASLRNRALFVGTSVIVAIIGWYTAWAVWSWVLLRQADYGVKSWVVFSHPRMVWEVICTVNKNGLWTIDNHTPTGFVLWGVWLAEAAAILGLAIYIPLPMATEDPCCERCQCWCERSGGLKVALMDTAEFKRCLEAHDLGYLSQFRPPSAGASQWLRLQLHSCPKCRELHTLTAKVATETPEATKAGAVKTETFMNQLLVSSSVARAIRELETKWDVAESQSL